MKWLSVEAGRAVTLELERVDDSLWIGIVGDPDAAPFLEVGPAAAAIAEGLRNMKTYARGHGESPSKVELEIAGGFVGIHATDHAVSIHLGRERGELVTNYVHIGPYDAGILAKHLEGSR